MESQSERKSDLNVYSGDDSIIDRIIYEKQDIRVKVNTITAIENLPVANVDIPGCVLSRLPIWASSVCLRQLVRVVRLLVGARMDKIKWR